MFNEISKIIGVILVLLLPLIFFILVKILILLPWLGLVICVIYVGSHGIYLLAEELGLF